MTENEISRHVYGAAIEVHKVLGGPGLLESIYEESLAYELTLRGLKVERQKRVPVNYKGHKIKEPLRLDLLVVDKVIVDTKATEKNIPIYGVQVLTYLRLTGLRLGMVVNFGYPLVTKGIQRIVNGL